MSYETLETSFKSLEMDLRWATTAFRHVFEAGLLVFRWVTLDPRRGSSETHAVGLAVLGLSHHRFGDPRHARGCLSVDALRRQWLGFGFVSAGLLNHNQWC
jgi:hypothetical protein